MVVHSRREVSSLRGRWSGRMTPQLGALTFHEHEALAEASSVDGGSAAVQQGAILPFPLQRATSTDGTERAQPWLLRSDAQHRRLLGAADLIACALTIALVLGTGR